MPANGYIKLFHATRKTLDVERFEERAAIHQHDAGLDLDDAEFEAALVQWVEQGGDQLQFSFLGA
jgi:hypothetical protein